MRRGGFANRGLRRRTLLLLVALLAAGCAEPPRHPRWLWPAPPATPRLEFIRSFSSERDLLPSRQDRLLAKVARTDRRHALFFPFGLASAGPGQILVIDQDQRILRRFDLATGAVRILAGPERLKRPLDLVRHPDGSLFVADDRRVLHLAAEGHPLGTVGEKELQNPAYLALDAARGRLYVSNSRTHRVEVFDLEGGHLFGFGGPGRGAGELHAPQGIAVGPDGKVFVADLFNARIQVFTADGEYLRQFGRRGTGAGEFEGPKDLGFDSEGHLHILDSRKNALLTCTPAGDLLLVTGGGPGTAHPLGFSAPTAIHITADDSIYISDRLNRRVSIWQYLNPRYLEAHPITADDLERLRALREGRAFR